MKRFLLVVCIFSYIGMPTTVFAETIETRIGKLSFTQDFANGYPTDETSKKLYEEMDFQRATQAYIWSTPLVSIEAWKYSSENDLGLKNGQIVLQESYRDKLGGLTYNAVTPYVLSFIDLGKGPWIVEIPEGKVRGAMHNIWQVGLTQMTKPGKYLFVGPESKVPSDVDGYIVVQSDTNTILMGIRLMSTEKAERLRILKQINVYTYAERANPKPRGYIEGHGKKWMGAAPRGLEYWQRLSDAINTNGPIHERDRFFMAMLKPLGIEKGKPFKPTAAQKKILEQGVLVGEAMVKAIDFDGLGRLDDAFYFAGSAWEIATTSPPDQRREHMDALDGRAAWFYEAVSNDIAMHGMVNGGWGQVYLTAYKDGDGGWLDGAQSYKLTLKTPPPVETFWAITLYEVSTRTLINNKEEKADLSSRQELMTNADGSMDLYFGPSAPEGKEKNWVQTEAGRGWFPYFRFYSPKKEVVERKWVLPDIEKVNW